MGLRKIGLTFVICAALGLAATQGAAEGGTRATKFMARVEAVMAQAPEELLAEWGARSDQLRRGAGLLGKAGDLADAKRITNEIARWTDRNQALGQVAILPAQDGPVLRGFKLLDAIDDPAQMSKAPLSPQAARGQRKRWLH